MKTISTTPAQAAAAAAAAAAADVRPMPTLIKTNDVVKHKRRYCRIEGCDRIVKSQGLCQRHGARPKICLAVGCTKQAQGNFDGMCKSHFKANKRVTTPLPPKPQPSAIPIPPPLPTGPSVYDRVIPESLTWDPSMGTTMPLILHLKDGFDAVKPPAWHRNEERAARGLFPIHNSATQLEGWERELVWMEILLLTGNPRTSFRHLARGWGRDKGFHMVLAQFICERHGDVQRKKRDEYHPASVLTAARRRQNESENNCTISANVWDDTCYGDTAYNEALAADLLDFSQYGRHPSDALQHPNTNAVNNHSTTVAGEREFSFELSSLPHPTSSDDDDMPGNDDDAGGGGINSSNSAVLHEYDAVDSETDDTAPGRTVLDAFVLYTMANSNQNNDHSPLNLGNIERNSNDTT